MRRNVALRVIYLDAILYFLGGLMGTGHHWYFSGQTNVNMALSALFSVLEVVPLTLLTLDAWDFVRTTRGGRDASGKAITLASLLDEAEQRALTRLAEGKAEAETAPKHDADMPD